MSKSTDPSLNVGVIGASPLFGRAILEEEAVRKLGDSIGYGRLMQLACQEWGKSLNANGQSSGGNFVIGPCSATVTQCGCSGAHTGDVCDWCCGTGWLTKHVREVQKTLTGK